MKGSNLFSDAPDKSFETVAKCCNTNEKEADVFCTLLYIFYFVVNANDDEK